MWIFLISAGKIALNNLIGVERMKKIKKNNYEIRRRFFVTYA